MIEPGILVCISFLISMCMFIVSKALLISSATMIVRGGGAIWFNPFSKVLFNVCSAVVVEGTRINIVLYIITQKFLNPLTFEPSDLASEGD